MSRGGGSRPLDILWVATKAPWPPIDGGRLLQWHTLGPLVAAGHRVRLVAPAPASDDEQVATREALEGLGGERHAAAREGTPQPGLESCLVEAPPRPRAVDATQALFERRAATLVRHDRPGIRRRVSAEIARRRPDVVHVEQLQAFAGATPARAAGLPIVLRAQNVESALAARAADRSPWPLRPLQALDARRLVRSEGEAVCRADAVLALTREDADALCELAGSVCPIRHLTAPFPARLPTSERRLEGAPALTLFGSRGWAPNLEGARDFVDRIWPVVRRRVPLARLHVFGLGVGEGVRQVTLHPAPDTSADAMPAGSVLVVPLRTASGLRMKILEAWARGVPVIASPRAAAGLDAEDGRELFVTDDAEAIADAVLALREADRYRHVVEAGRSALVERHAPRRLAERWVEIARSVGAGASAPEKRREE